MGEQGRVIVEEFAVPEETGRLRLDRFLSLWFREYSRSFLARAIREGRVTVSDRPAKPSYAVRPGEVIRVELPVLAADRLEPEDIPLEVLYEDEQVIAVNKPPDMVVHPSRGHGSGTLANALLYHCKCRLSDAGGPLRPGVVHRLDRDTSGVILAAKTNPAHAELSRQFKERRVHKEYLAVVRGRMEHDSGEISLPVGRDPRMRERMRVALFAGRPAISRYFVEERFERFTVLRVEPLTGRTHQIRVHLSAERHPVVADALYGGGAALRPSELRGRPPQPDEPPLIERQALHAAAITFTHPTSGEEIRLRAPLPGDILSLLEALRRSAAN